MPCIQRAAAAEILPGVFIHVYGRAAPDREHAPPRRHHLRWRVVPPRRRSGALGLGTGRIDFGGISTHSHLDRLIYPSIQKATAAQQQPEAARRSEQPQPDRRRSTRCTGEKIDDWIRIPVEASVLVGGGTWELLEGIVFLSPQTGRECAIS